MVQVNSWWSAARDGTSTKECGTHFGDKIRRPLQVMVGGKRAWNSRELDGARCENSVMEAAEDYLENCASMKVDIEVLERLIEPENLEICQRYMYSTRGGSNIFQLFDTSEKQDHFVAKRWLVG